MKKLLLILCILTLSLCGCGGEKAVAEVNGEALTLDEFEFYWDNLSKIYSANNEELSEDMKQTVAEQLVYDTLLEQAMAEYGNYPSAEEEEAFYLAEMELAYGSYEDGLALIEEYGLDEDFFRYQYRCRLYEECIMDELSKENDVTVSEDEAQELYDAAPELYDWRDISRLLVKPYAADGRILTADSEGKTIYTEEEWANAKEKCEKYLAEIESGESFSSMALKYSDSVDANNGGRLGELLYRDSQGYDPVFIDAAFAFTEPGQYSKTPLRTDEGYVLIYLNDLLSPADMEEVLDYIIETTTDQRRRSLLVEAMAEKEAASDIVYHESVWDSVE